MSTHPSQDTVRSRAITLDRALLLLILCLQGVILAVVFGKPTERFRGSDPETEKAPLQARAATPAVHAPDTASVGRPGSATPSFVLSPLPSARALHQSRRLQNEMDRMFERAVNDLGFFSSWMDIDHGWESLTRSPTLDMQQKDDAYVVVFSLPGRDPADVSVTLEGRMLTVLAPSHQHGGHSPANVYQEKVLLPGPVVGANRAEAVLTNGVLKVIIPRSRSLTTSGEPFRIL